MHIHGSAYDGQQLAQTLTFGLTNIEPRKDGPARRQILLTIHFRGAANAGEIAARFAHKWPTTTRHLRVLEEAGLVQHEE
jgi:DNA-binding MarR family transcriptional regulator